MVRQSLSDQLLNAGFVSTDGYSDTNMESSIKPSVNTKKTGAQILNEIGCGCLTTVQKYKKTETAGYAPPEIAELPGDWEIDLVDISVSSYYNQLIIGLDKRHMPLMKRFFISGDHVYMSPSDLKNLVDLQKSKGRTVNVTWLANNILAIKKNKMAFLFIQNSIGDK